MGNAEVAREQVRFYESKIFTVGNKHYWVCSWVSLDAETNELITSTFQVTDDLYKSAKPIYIGKTFGDCKRYIEGLAQ